MATKQEFIQKIREKYPQYENIDDETLYGKILEKYPTYKDQITEDKPLEKTGVKPSEKTGDKTFAQKAGDFALESLPVLGGIGGAFAGSGVASVPLAGLGAAAGEGLKQRIKMGLGQQQEFNPKTVQNTAIGGALGQGLGLGMGKAFTFAMPKIGSALAKINSKDYTRALNNPKILSLTQKNAGKQVGVKAKELASMKELPLDEAKSILNDTLKGYGKQRINPLTITSKKVIKDTNALLEQSAKETGTVNLEDIHGIKRMLQEKAKYDKKYRGESGEFIKKLASNFAERLNKVSPAYESANRSFQDALIAEQFRKTTTVNPFVGGGGAWGVSSGHPIFGGVLLSRELLKQPLAHQYLIRAYGATKGIPTGAGIGAGIGGLYNQ